MMRYFLLPKAITRHAQSIQRRVYEMARPETLRDPADVTLYYSGVVTHPTSGEVALCLTGDTIPLHVANIPDRLIDYLKTVLTATQQTKIKNYVIAHRGEQVDVLGMLADTYWPTRVRTQAQMDAGGWFPAPTI